MVSLATAAEKKSSAEKVPLEKKLDKRGLLNLGYGYGINDLGLGYLGKADYGGLAHAAPAYSHGPVYSHGPAYAHGAGFGHGLGLQGYGYGPYVADVTKTVTLVKGVPVPVDRPVSILNSMV